MLISLSAVQAIFHVRNLRRRIVLFLSSALLMPNPRLHLDRVFNHIAYALCEWDHATALKHALCASHDAVVRGTVT